MKFVSLILRVSLTLIASFLLLIPPVNAQLLTPVNTTSRVELVSSQSDITAIQPPLSHSSPSSQSENWECNCHTCMQARLLLLGKLPLTSLI
ncbi:hypothetical protein NIES3974_46430 [Calothrix sp. NIES-3974]|nr:hypothetical protein NIES3974_46430 [Calothrix sp. NIES-3974]